MVQVHYLLIKINPSLIRSKLIQFIKKYAEVLSYTKTISTTFLTCYSQ